LRPPGEWGRGALVDYKRKGRGRVEKMKGRGKLKITWTGDKENRRKSVRECPSPNLSTRTSTDFPKKEKNGGKHSLGRKGGEGKKEERRVGPKKGKAQHPLSKGEGGRIKNRKGRPAVGKK